MMRCLLLNLYTCKSALCCSRNRSRLQLQPTQFISTIVFEHVATAATELISDTVFSTIQLARCAISLIGAGCMLRDVETTLMPLHRLLSDNLSWG